jgi:hypothetical protein
MKYWQIFIILFLCSFSCARERKSDTFTIKGNFPHSAGEKIILCEMDVKNVIALDSANIGKEGAISFTHTIEQSGFYMIRLPGQRKIFLLVKKNENILVQGDLKDPGSEFKVSGSEGSELLQEFFHESLKNIQKIDSIKNILHSKEGSEDFLRYSMSADSTFQGISEDQKKMERSFINEHPESLASLIVVNYASGPRPFLTLEGDFPYYLKLNRLAILYPKNKDVQYHMSRINLYLHNLQYPGN